MSATTNPKTGARIGRMAVAFGTQALFFVLTAMVFFPNAGRGAPLAYFGPLTNFSTAGHPVSMAVGDFNHDGRPDIAVATVNGVSVLLNGGGGAMTAPSNYYAYGGNAAVLTGDFNGDGNLDICVVPDSSNPVTLLCGDGKGSFPVQSYPAGTGYGYSGGAAIGDFNKDGNLDLAIAFTGNPCIVSVLATPYRRDRPQRINCGDVTSSWPERPSTRWASIHPHA